MVTRSLIFAPDEYYHVYNRGVDKRTIFESESDYKRFQELLYLSNSKDAVNVRDIKRVHDSVYDVQTADPQVSVAAYCLMSNHFHILLKPNTDSGVSTFLGKLQTSYSMYFNKRHERTGALFQGRFKAKHVTDDVYLKYLFAYIHLNPVRHQTGMSSDLQMERLKQYRYSSLLDFITPQSRQESVIVRGGEHVSEFYFSNPGDWFGELNQWLQYDKEEEINFP